MLTLCSFLQSLLQLVKPAAVKLAAWTVRVSRRMYRSMAVITAGTVVVAVLTFTSSGFAGGGKTALTAYAETPAREPEEELPEEEGIEEIAQITEAKIQFRLTRTDQIKEGQALAFYTLVEDVRRQEAVREEERAVVAATKEEIRQVEEERAAYAEQEAKAAAAVVRYSQQDYEVLKRIVQAEAGICDIKGRILVANVIINRVKSGDFPNTITDVVYQKSQFSPVYDGNLNSCTVTQETVEAVDRALSGEDYSQGALYFMNRGRSCSSNVSWFDRNLTYLFDHDRHEFFK